MNKVTVKKNTAVSTDVVDFSTMSGSGFENVTSSEVAIPFLKIASSQSPEMKKANSKFVDGLEEGFIFNSVTREFWENIKVVPCFFRVRGVEWEPLGTGTGAPINIYKPENIPTLHRGTDGEDHYMVNGQPSQTYIVRTAEYFVLRLNADGSFEPAQIIMQKTQYKKSKYWNTTMLSQKLKSPDGQYKDLPMFANTYTMSAVHESNSKNDWWGWKIDLDKSVNDLSNPAYIVREAQNFKELVKAGDIDPAPEQTTTNTEETIVTHKDDVTFGASQ